MDMEATMETNHESAMHTKSWSICSNSGSQFVLLDRLSFDDLIDEWILKVYFQAPVETVAMGCLVVKAFHFLFPFALGQHPNYGRKSFCGLLVSFAFSQCRNCVPFSSTVGQEKIVCAGIQAIALKSERIGGQCKVFVGLQTGGHPFGPAQNLQL